MEIPYTTKVIYGIEVKVRKTHVPTEIEMKLGGGIGYFYRLEDIEDLYAFMMKAFSPTEDKLAAIRKILDS